MLATSLQQWARQYLRRTQPARCSPHKRARLRTFFANGVDKFGVTWAVEALPALVHLSLFIFIAGLVIYLFNINHTVFTTVASWVGLLSGVYLCITLMPSFWHDSPYYSPLSSTGWLVCSFLLWTVCVPLLVFISIPLYPFRNASKRYGSSVDNFLAWFGEGVKKEAEEVASKGSSEIDGRILEWTTDALSEDDALEEFLGAIPGFYKSDVVKDLQQHVPLDVWGKILNKMISFLNHFLSSNSVPASVKIRRLTICLNAAGAMGTSSGVECLFREMPLGSWHGAPHSVEVGHYLTSWSKANNGQFARSVRAINARIVSSALERDDRWIALAMECLGVSEGVLRGYLAHGDSVQLACLILFSRGVHRPLLRMGEDLLPVWELDIRNTLPGLQHDFCSLWNEFIQETRNRRWYDNNPYDIVIEIRHLYNALHQDTEGAPTALTVPDYRLDDIVRQVSSYPLCSLPSHRSDSTPHAHELSAAETPHRLTTTSINVPHCDTALETLTPSSLPGSHLDDSTPHQSDEPSLAINSSLSAPQLSPSNLATSDFHSTQLPVTSIPEAVFIPSSSTINSPQRTDNDVDLRPFPTSSSQSNEIPPNQGLHLPNSGHGTTILSISPVFLSLPFC